MSGDGAPHEGAPGPEAEAAAGERSEEELRAAYEEELSRITSSEVMLQAAVSLLNLGGWRLGPPAGAVAGEHGEPAAGQRDLEQVRDAIDGVRALLGVAAPESEAPAQQSSHRPGPAEASGKLWVPGR